MAGDRSLRRRLSEQGRKAIADRLEQAFPCFADRLDLGGRARKHSPAPNNRTTRGQGQRGPRASCRVQGFVKGRWDEAFKKKNWSRYEKASGNKSIEFRPIPVSGRFDAEGIVAGLTRRRHAYIMFQ